jgi:hypothetical protein
MRMNLQIKDAGAWRNLVRPQPSTIGAVMCAAAELLRSLQEPRTVMRIMVGDTQLYTCSAPTYLWMPCPQPADTTVVDGIVHTICTICDGSGTWEGKACACRSKGT